jgi:hypothetical protein
MRGLPDDTPRDHPKVYRADVVGVNHPNAKALAHSWEHVDMLLAEVHRLCTALGREATDG